jgi:hypothetical protein
MAHLCLILALLLPLPGRAQDEAEELPRAQFEAGVARLRTQIEEIAQGMRGVHGATYIAEAVTRPTGQYIALLLRALANDPQSIEICDAVRRHFLERLTGARTAEQLEDAAVLLMERVFLGREATSAAAASPAARRLAAQTSVTVELSWRKCAGWLSDWHPVT